MEFLDWLKNEKGFSQCGAYDVASRVRRVHKLLGITKTSSKTISLLQNSEQYKELSRYVKPQLMRACVLHLEYLTEL